MVGLRPLGKFGTVKAIVFFSWWQVRRRSAYRAAVTRAVLSCFNNAQL